MIWFRTKLKYGATLALLALAINFALAFGHCHADGNSSHRAAGLFGASLSDDGSVPLGTNDDDGCAICKAVAAMGTALAPTPPALPSALNHARLDLAPADELAVWQSPRTDVRARGPPPLTSQS
jgi:hypothetical protein